MCLREGEEALKGNEILEKRSLVVLSSDLETHYLPNNERRTVDAWVPYTNCVIVTARYSCVLVWIR